ncbi:MAG TPA: response regulator [Gemmatimonadales bacterium]|nr:response regulator [Gemmatimonadales bacterium]
MARVLVAEDDADVRRVVGRVLARLGHEVHDVADGTAALRLIAEMPFDLVITDVYMATVDGLELLERMQQQHLGVPVVVMSGGGFKSRQYVLKIAASCGASAILEKPFTLNELRAAVEPLLQKAG